MLVFWTAAEPSIISKTIGLSLKSFRPDVPKHAFAPWTETDETPIVPGHGDVVVVCGKKPLASLQKAGIFPKNRTLSSLRERPTAHNGGHFLVTFDPGSVSSEPQNKELIDWDIRLAHRLMITGSTEPVHGKSRYVNDFSDLIEWIGIEHGKTGKPVDVSCDTETMGFYPWYPDKDIVSIAFTGPRGTADVLYLGPQEHPIELGAVDLYEQIKWLLTSPKVRLRLANGKYDLIWIAEKWGIECTNFKFDTMLVGSLVDENRCVAPETKLLTSDLRWVEAGSVLQGDDLVGFDENPPDRSGKGFPHRRMRKAKVLSTEVIQKPRLRLNLSNGSSIVVSNNHQFLCRKYPSTHVKVWRRADRIKEGCVICHATPAPHRIRGAASDFDIGRLSGFLDGEGSVPKLNEHGSWSLNWGQKPHTAHQDMKRIASEIGFGWREHDDILNVCKSVIAKGAYSSLHALIATRPLRLVAKEPWVNGPLPRPQDDVVVLSVEDLGVGPVVALETDTHTFIAEGLLSHNSNSLNLHAKLFTSYGGYDDCVAPETKVLTADLEWVPVGEVLPGDELVGFEEFNAPNSRRRLKLAKAVSTKRLKKPGYRITFSDGRAINCSKDHGFLARRFKSGGPFTWTHASELKVGCEVQCGAPVEQAVNERSAGYVSGLYDGEGYVDMSSDGMRSGISQRPGVVWDTYTAVMERHGLGGFYAHQKNGDGVMTSKHGGWETLRMLQLFRPQRLIDKRPFDGKCIPSGGPKVTVASIEDIGEIEVVSLQTSTHTFIAEGVCSHNSFNQTEDKGAMETIPPDKLLPYAGGDTIACQDVADVLKDQLLEDEQLTTFYVNILHPAARAFEKVERRGVVIDKEKYEALGDELRTVVKQQQDAALAIIPNKMRIKYKDKIEDQIAAGKNPLTPKILKEFFFTPHGLNLKPKEVTAKTGEPSMTKSHLRQFADNPAAKEMVGILTEMDSAAKTLSTFVEGFLKHLRPDGRLHPTYFLAHGAFDGYDDDDAGTVTGRLSAKDPAIQTLPKKTKWGKRLRECYPAPKGKVVLNADFAQGELKIVACVANEKTMLKAYEDKLDLHAVTGAKLAGVDLKEFLTWKNHESSDLSELYEKHRSNAKPANFGLLYGMGVEGFQAYAWANYGIKLTYEEAEKMRNAFFELYPGLLTYHETQREIVKFHEAVRTPLGRIRHLPTIRSWDRAVRAAAERQAINSPIQGALTDMMIWAIALLEDAYPGNELEIVAMIHDALIAYVPENEVELWAKRVTDVMANLPFHKIGWKPQLKFTADAEAGPDLAHLSGIKLAA